MPEVTCSRSLPADAQTIWEFVEDMDNWAPFIMGYQKHQTIDDRRSNWTVKGELGALARTVSFDVTITEWAGPDRVLFTIAGTTEAFDGAGGFYIGEDQQMLDGTLSGSEESAANEARRRGPLRRLWDALFRRRRHAGSEGGDAPAAPAAATTAVSPTNAAPPANTVGRTQFTFMLTLQAGGMTGPVVNVMLEPLMRRAADEFAERLTDEVLRRAAA